MNDLSVNAYSETWNIDKLEEYLDEVRGFDDFVDEDYLGNINFEEYE